MLPKDYLRYCLTQTIHMEYSDACSTLLFNPEIMNGQEMLEIHLTLVISTHP